MENKETQTISSETAERDFNSWCEAVGIEFDAAEANEEEVKDFARLKKTIVKAIQERRCVVDGDSLEYTLGNYETDFMNHKTVKIAPPTGKLFLGMDGYKDTQQMHKLYGAMSALSGLDVGVFSKMKIVDWKFFQAVLVLFLSI